MINNIVVGIDGSKAAEKALHAACDLANKYSSDIHLVHTPHPQTVAFALGAAPGYRAATTMPSAEEVDAASEIIVNEGKKIAKQYDLEFKTTNTERGDTAEQIIACVDACGADLVITGRRGLGGITSLLQGSTTQQVNRLAKCACMSVV